MNKSIFHFNVDPRKIHSNIAQVAASECRIRDEWGSWLQGRGFEIFQEHELLRMQVKRRRRVLQLKIYFIKTSDCSIKNRLN